MKIVENINYSIDDVIDAVNDELGFSYIRSSDSSGYINLGKGIKVLISFNPDRRELESIRLSFPEKIISLLDSNVQAELYSSTIESAVQISDLIKSMLGKGEIESEDTE